MIVDHMLAARESGLDLKIVLDIGSYHGQFGDMIEVVWPHAQVISIEAEKAHSRINPRQITALLSDKDNEWVEFYTLPEGIVTGASIYKELTPWYDHPKINILPTVTLDTLYKRYKWQAPWAEHGLIKMDTQGSELAILQGGIGFLKEAKPLLLLVETSDTPYNQGAPTTSDVVSWLLQRGYQCVDEWDQTMTYNKISQRDLLFKRTTG